MVSVGARAATALRPGGGRREFLRGVWDGESVTAQAVQDSGALAPLAASNALIDRPAREPAAQAGDRVSIYLLDGGGMA